MRGPHLSGQILVRNKGEKDGRTLYMVVGIIAVPTDQAFLDGHQYTVIGATNAHLALDHTAPLDRHQETLSMDANTMLTSPLWRV